MTANLKSEVDPQREAEEQQRQQERAALARLVERAEGSDLTVLPQLRAALDAHPEIWKGYGDLAGQAEAAMITLTAGTNLLLGESLQRKLAATKAELRGEASSPLEKLLVERV